MSDLDLEKSMLSFKNFTVSKTNPPQPIISNISGYVLKGGITAGPIPYIDLRGFLF